MFESDALQGEYEAGYAARQADEPRRAVVDAVRDGRASDAALAWTTGWWSAWLDERAVGEVATSTGRAA